MFHGVMPLAMRNLVVAQHWDKTRFLKVRGDRWDRPKPRNLVKDFVMVNRPTKGALCILTHPQVPPKAIQFRKSGVVVLQGRNGEHVLEQTKNVASCFRDCGRREQEEAILT